MQAMWPWVAEPETGITSLVYFLVSCEEMRLKE
jgi:hypothetical protein